MSQNETVARPYAKAAFELAFAENALPKWSEMLAGAALIAENENAISMMKNPRYTKAELVALFLDLGKDCFTLQMQNFIYVLAEFNRLIVLPEISRLYADMRAQSEKMLTVELISALPIEESYRQRFTDALKKRMQCNITLECVTDQSILGGAIIRAKDLVIDGSIRGRLARLGDAVGIS